MEPNDKKPVSQLRQICGDLEDMTVFQDTVSINEIRMRLEPACDENDRELARLRDQLRAATHATSEARAAEVEAAIAELSNAAKDLWAPGKNDSADRINTASEKIRRLMRSAPAAPGAEAVLRGLRDWIVKWRTEGDAACARHPTVNEFAKGYRDGISWAQELTVDEANRRIREIDKLLPPGNAAPGGAS